MLAFLLRIWGLARRYRGRLLLGVLTGVVSGLIEPLMIVAAVFVYGLIFHVQEPITVTVPPAASKFMPEFARHWFESAHQWMESAQQTLSSNLHTHPWSAAALVAVIPLVMLLRGVFSYLNIYFLQWAAIRTVTDLRTRLFDHLMNLSAGFFSRHRTGELVSRLMGDTGVLQNIISNAMSVLVKDPVTLIGMLILLLSQAPRLTLLSVVILPVCVVPIVIYNQKVRRSTRAMQLHSVDLSNVATESFAGNRIIKAYNLEATVVQRFKETGGKFIGHYMRIVRSSEIPGPLLEFVGAIGVALVLLYLVTISPEKAPTQKEFLVFVGGIFSMYRPLKNITRLYNNLHQARVATERVFEFLATQNDIPEPARPKALRAAGAAIEFDDVAFAYDAKPVLEGINLTVKPGELVALVGASGSGKTTLTHLLLRFYDPTQGAIRIGGTDLREVSSRDLRNQIAVVTQETVLFFGSIRHNIELGRPGATDADIIQAAKHAYAYDFIMKKPQGFESQIAELGTGLSGGERQRVAIARALVKNAPILVLDEATNSLDAESERIVQAALEELMVGRTTLCIAHRLSTIQKADRILVMDAGHIVESGTHAELLQARGVYAKLYELAVSTGSPEPVAT
ncbi:MAG TPA: ABC transporter ATP-binding protein [Candidatus Acidoferrum sp.]|nr:ABC transporter ATP-binding protein [Candidatus Acidoferrum sp.]